MIRSLLKFNLVLALVLYLGACTLNLGSSGPKVRYPNQVSAEMQASFNVAESKFKASKFDLAKKDYLAYLKTFPYNKLSDLSAFRIGQIYMIDRDYSHAIAQFDKLVTKSPDPRMKARARVKAGISAYRLKNHSKALSYFSQAEDRYLSSREQAKSHGLSLYARTFLQQGTEEKAFDFVVLLDVFGSYDSTQIKKRFGSELPNKTAVLKKLRGWAEEEVDLSKIDKRLMSYNYKGKASEPYVLFKLAKSYQRGQDLAKAKRFYKRYLSKYPNGVYSEQAEKILASLGGSFSLDKKGVTKVGVILPLSGQYSVFGQKTLRGMECAAGLKVECKTSAKIRLVQKDDKGSPDEAVKAVEELVSVHKVNVIVGPLSSKVSAAAAKKAKELGVVLISLAQKPGISGVGSNIYSLGLTPDQQVRSLLSYLNKKRGINSVSVLYPNNNYGSVFSGQISKNAKNYGTKVNAKVSFGQSNVDISSTLLQIPKGTGAIFIPDSFNTVLKIGPVLESMGFSKSLLVGTNAWNDEKFAQYSGKFQGRTVFVDIFFDGSANGRVREFVSQFRQAYGVSPSTLEAMGYDSIRFLDSALQGKKEKSLSEIKSSIAGHNSFKGVTGLRGFRSDRTALVEPYLLSVSNGKIIELN